MDAVYDPGPYFLISGTFADNRRTFADNRGTLADNRGRPLPTGSAQSRQGRFLSRAFDRNRRLQSAQTTNPSPGRVETRWFPTTNGLSTSQGRISSGTWLFASVLSAVRRRIVWTSAGDQRRDSIARSRSATSVHAVTTTGEAVSVSSTTTTTRTPSATSANRQPSVGFYRSCPRRIASLTSSVDAYRPGWPRRSRKWSVSE